MGTTLRVLFVENFENDPPSALRELRRGGYDPTFVRVDTPAAMEDALSRGGWDMVIADHQTTSFGAMEALGLLQRKDLDLPLIILSNNVDENVAMAALGAGARDYVAKGDPTRLRLVVARELREAKTRRERKRAEEELRLRDRAIAASSNGMIITDPNVPDNPIVYANSAFERITGYSAEEAVGRNCRFLQGEDRAQPAAAELRAAIRERRECRVVIRNRKKDGTPFWNELSISPVYDEDGRLTSFVGVQNDVTTGRRRIEEALRESEERFRALIRNASDVTLLIETDGTILYESPAVERMLGFQPEERIGATIFDLLHPDDVESARDRLVECLGRPAGSMSMQYRMRNKEGSWRRFEVTGSNLLHDPVVGGIVINSHDITKRVTVEEALRQSEELYRAIVEQAAEMIFLVDAVSKRILKTNAAFHESLGYAPEELLRRMTLYDVVAHDRQSVDRDVRRVLKGDRLAGERRYRRKDGSSLNVEVSASSIPYGRGEAICVVARDVTERKRTEKELHQSLEALLAVYEAGHILGSTLEAEEIGSRLLQLMQRISSSTTAVISVPDEHQQLRVWRAIGFENLWRQARYTLEVQATLRAVMESGEYTFSQLEPPIPAAELLVGLFLPLRIRNRTIGVLEIYGPDAMTEKNIIDILLNLTTKAASALENARLYRELAEREHQLQELVGTLIATQEEERRRVAYEVHDGPTQVAVAAYQHLQAFARDHSPDTPEGRRTLENAVDLARRTVGESRQIIANLRPTALDDFGLAAAIRLQVEALRAEGWLVSYEETLGNERIPDPIETALYRVAQEALTNARKHARATRVRVRLGSSGDRVWLRIRDWGRGFRLASSPDNGPGERVGLASMRERVSLVGGEMKFRSIEGVGTLVAADIPLTEEAGRGGIDPGQRLVQRLIHRGRSSVNNPDG